MWQYNQKHQCQIQIPKVSRDLRAEIDMYLKPDVGLEVTAPRRRRRRALAGCAVAVLIHRRRRGVKVVCCMMLVMMLLMMDMKPWDPIQ